jgi:hypothetical protein
VWYTITTRKKRRGTYKNHWYARLQSRQTEIQIWHWIYVIKVVIKKTSKEITVLYLEISRHHWWSQIEFTVYALVEPVSGYLWPLNRQLITYTVTSRPTYTVCFCNVCSLVITWSCILFSSTWLVFFTYITIWTCKKKTNIKSSFQRSVQHVELKRIQDHVITRLQTLQKQTVYVGLDVTVSRGSSWTETIV